MLVLVLFTFGCAGLTDVSAERADLCGMNAASRHEARRQSANGGAVDVVTDALGHHADVVFSEAGSRAMVAGVGTGVTGIDAGLMLFV